MGINKSLFNKHYIIKMVEEPKNAAADGEEEMPALENQEGPKLNRGEKKCRKALTKLGMKQFPGISRVTVKRRDGFIFMINDPEVLISGDDGNHFVCFGKLEYDDPTQRMAAAEAQRMQAQQQAAAASDEAAEDEAGITPNHINMVMDHTNCTRNEAIRALRDSNDDMINAVMKLSGS